MAAEALLITSQVELINKREFATTALDENSETIVIHIAALEVPTAMLIYPLRIFLVQNSKPTLAILQ